MRGSLLGLAELRRQPAWKLWRDLSAGAPPFLEPEFFALAAPFHADKPHLVACAWDEGALIGTLPLARDDGRLVALRCDHSPSYDYLGAREGLDAIWRTLRADPEWSELVLPQIPATSPLVTRLPALAASDGCPTVLRCGHAHAYFALPGAEARMSPKFRANLARCERKAGGVELERIAVPDRAAFDEALAIEAMAWKGAAGTAIVAEPHAAHLYRALAVLMGRRGRGALYFLRIAGRRIAMLLAVEDERTLYALKIGYDPSVANLSPGHLLVWKVAKEAAARGLQELDFGGREDDWKRKWTQLGHDHVTLVIFRDTARGLAHYAASVLLRPHLPATVRESLRSPLPRRCQRADILGAHSLVARIRGRLTLGLGIKSGLRRLLRPPPPRPWLGKPSAFPSGSWVRVKPFDQLRATLDDRNCTRGLEFTVGQRDTAGRVFRTAQHVRRLRDDHGQFRPVSRTVLLEGVDCSGEGATDTGCGRHCPMMYRDEWLEPASATSRGPRPSRPARHAHVRDLSEVLAGLDFHGRRDGLTFMPEMRAYVARRFAIANRLTRVFEYDRWIETRAPVYILKDLRCTGAVLGAQGPCDRACALMWHQDWLMIEP